MFKSNFALALTSAFAYAQFGIDLPDGIIHDMDTPTDYCCWFYGSSFYQIEDLTPEQLATSERS